MKPVLLLDVPVLHRGYIQLFQQYALEVSGLYLFAPELVGESDYLAKEIRSLDPRLVAEMVSKLRWFEKVRLVDERSITTLASRQIITATDEICRQLVAKYLPDSPVRYEPIFLRWDSSSVRSSSSVVPDLTIELGEFDRRLFEAAKAAAARSSDWWRQIGGVIFRGGVTIVSGWNRHLPNEQTPYAVGDPRDFIPPGESAEICSSIHVEAEMIARAARWGFGLDGADIYLTVFPCPPCAKLIARAGIATCYFSAGNAYLDAEDVLRASGVKLVLVALPETKTPPS